MYTKIWSENCGEADKSRSPSSCSGTVQTRRCGVMSGLVMAAFTGPCNGLSCSYLIPSLAQWLGYTPSGFVLGSLWHHGARRAEWECRDNQEK